jgi:hypothetical protein
MEVSKETYLEIFRLLSNAGYAHAFHGGNGKIGDDCVMPVLDMHGLALKMADEYKPVSAP